MYPTGTRTGTMEMLVPARKSKEVCLVPVGRKNFDKFNFDKTSISLKSG